MEALGIPSTLIITEPFESIVAYFAPTVGLEEYPASVAVPHRVSTMDDDDLRKIAESVVDEALARLTAPA